MRFKLVVSYLGTYFHGAVSNNAFCVKNTLEEACLALFHEPIKVFFASRTDKGVHALGQVVHFDASLHKTEYEVFSFFNWFLRKHYFGNVTVISVCITSEDFHSRFSAKKKTYLYRVACSKNPIPFEKERSFHFYKKLDLSFLNEAMKELVGTQDFKAFCKEWFPDKRTILTIDDAYVKQINYILYCVFEFYIIGRSFVYNQIRLIVGTLLHKAKKLGDIKQIIESKNVKNAGNNLPGYGLYLLNIEY